MKTPKILALLVALLFNAIIAVALTPALPISAFAIFGGLTTLSLIPKGMVGILPMAIQKEIWINDIVENIFKQNPHLNFAMNADQFVLSGKVVHIPNAGSKPGVKRNRDKLPASVIIREDVDITYSLDEYTTDPILIPNAESYELSYDKRSSVTSEQSNALSELVGDWFFRYWAPSGAANIVRTTGATVAAHFGSGSRKALKVVDIKRMQKTFNKMGIPAKGRVACLDADMYDQLTDDLSVTQERDFSKALNEKEGIVGRLYGFDFLEPRPTVLRYTNDTVPVVKDPDSSIAAADNGAGLFWHKDLVIRSMGEKDFFENEGDALYYGDVYSGLLRAGGRIKRNDQNGVVALVQTAV